MAAPPSVIERRFTMELRTRILGKMLNSEVQEYLKENDIIIYLYNNNIVVKRCVAVENTPLDYLTNSGYILIVNSDKKIPLTREQYYNMHNCSEVPSGYILAIGDNFENSFDSRNYGFIPVSNVLGKVICR